MKGGGAALGEGGEPMAERFVPGWSGRETIEQRPEIKTGPTGDDGDASLCANCGQGLAGEAGISAGRELLAGGDDIEEMMRNAAPGWHRELGRADVQPLIDLNGIAVYDFTIGGLGEPQSQFALPRTGGAEHDQKRIGRGGRVTVHRRFLIRSGDCGNARIARAIPVIEETAQNGRDVRRAAQCFKRIGCCLAARIRPLGAFRSYTEGKQLDFELLKPHRRSNVSPLP